MAIYDLGTASLAANGEVTGVGTTWKAPLTLIRVGATIVFKTDPVQIYTISEIISDTQINVYNPNSETVPAGTGYAILAHDGITVQGLAQDVAETLRYYQSRETEVADAVDAFNNFDAADFDSKVTQVNMQHGDVVSIGSQVSADAAQVSSDKDEAAASALSAGNDKELAAISAQQAYNYAQSINPDNLVSNDVFRLLSQISYQTISEMISDNDVVNGSVVFIKGFHSQGDGGHGFWVRNDGLPSVASDGSVHFISGNLIVSGPSGFKFSFFDVNKSLSLKQIGATEDSPIDSFFSKANSYCLATGSKLNVIGNFTHENPLVVSAGVFVDYLDPRKSSTTKTTNNKSGLPTLTVSYGGNLVMDVDAAIILDHGYGHRLDNFNIKHSSPTPVEHAIYHGFTREVEIATGTSRIGDSSNKFVNGVTAQQGFVHSYGYIMSYCSDSAWNYILNSASTGCNLINIKTAWNYSCEGTAIKFQAATNINLGQQYCEGTKRRIYEFTGVTGGVIDVLTIDNHSANSSADSVLYSRNSQITIGCMTVNSLSVPEGQGNTMFIQHTVGAGIYGCLTINGITARTNQINTPRLITVTKDDGGDGNNCVIRGVPIPNIGASGNQAVTSNSSVSHQTNTGRTTTSHNRTVIGSYQSQAVGLYSAVLNGHLSYASTEGATVISSRYTRSASSYEVCGGYSSQSSGDPATSNRKWSIDSINGTIKSTGAITGGSTLADFAEMFENNDLGIIPIGSLVKLVGGKVSVASVGDDVIGVASATAGLVLNSSSLSWSGKYKRSDFGEPVYRVDELGNRVMVLSDDYDESHDYIPREERPEEWTCVGMIGQVFVRYSGDVKPGDYLSADSGFGVKSESKTNIIVMEVVSEKSCKCLIK